MTVEAAADLLAKGLKEHEPGIYTDIPESSWLCCSCGWQVPEYEGGKGYNFDPGYDDWVGHFLGEMTA